MVKLQEVLNVNYEKSSIYYDKSCYSYGAVFSLAGNLAYAFKKIGLEVQSRVVVISSPCIEWIICDLACIQSGITTVPMFHNSSAENLKFQIENCKAKVMILENDEVYERIAEIVDVNGFQVFFVKKSVKHSHIKTIMELALSEKSSGYDNVACVPQSAIATIIYTSGTSGRPKGVALTFENLATQMQDITLCFKEINNTDVAISVLPFAHIFQRTIVHFFISRGVTIHIVNDITNVVKHIGRINPTLITVVPRVLEKIYIRTKNQIAQKPLVVKQFATWIFEKSSKEIIACGLVWKLFNAILFGKVRKIFGHNIRFIVCGGAKISKNQETFFINARLPFFQGYGMTECSPVIASNHFTSRKNYTVGKPFPSVHVEIQAVDGSNEGEVCVNGDSVFAGYLDENGEIKTRENQIFHTADRGFLDSDGFLTITGRMKETFKNANGKFVDVLKIEEMLCEISGIELACVVAEGRSFTTALLFTQRTNTHEVMQEVAKINKRLEHWECVQYVHLTNEKPTAENGIITPSMKIRRIIIEEKYKQELDKFYV